MPYTSARRAGALFLVAAFAAVAVPLSPEQRRLNTASFDTVWSKVRDRHWDPKLGGLDWNAVRAELRPRVERAESMEAARAVIRKMLHRLGQSHFGILPADVYSDVESAAMHDGSIGVDVRVVEDRALVVSVEPGSPAAAAGIAPGWIVTRAQGRELTPVLARIRKAQEHSGLLGLTLRRTALAMLSSPAGGTVRAEFLDGRDRAVRKELTATALRGRLARFGNLPPQYVWSEAHNIERDGTHAGYIAFNMFLDPVNVMATINTRMESCLKQCDGIVIDLRGNPGGLGIMSMGIAGWFVSRPDQMLGTMYMRETSLKFVISPRPETYTGPLAILVDSSSASTSEIFAGGLKDLGRARIFGERTAGAALPSVIEKLPNGDGFQFAIANYVSEGGKPLEGAGVVPDVAAPVTRDALLAGKDPALDAALEWIGSRKSGRPAALQ